MLLNADLIPIFQKAATLKGRINVCEREPVKASAGVSVAKITLISYMGGRGRVAVMNALWAGWVIFGEQFVSVKSLALLRRDKCAESAGDVRVSTRTAHILQNICIFILNVFTYPLARALRCPGGTGHRRALLQLRVYLQTVTLMQRNDYFYSRHLGGPFPLSGMAPHRPTDYLRGCCHTWLLQLSLRRYTLRSVLFLFPHLHLPPTFINPYSPLNYCTFTPFFLSNLAPWLSSEPERKETLHAHEVSLVKQYQKCTHTVLMYRFNKLVICLYLAHMFG